MAPVVSLVMPMCNSGKYVRDAVESIRNQTLREFEFIIIDDGSTDNSVDTVRALKDSRIRLLRNERNLGVAASLNIGLAASKAEYIARMDADDVSMPDRLAKQVAFLKANAAVGLCGTWTRCFGGGRRYVLTYPTGADCVKSYLLLGNPLAHPSVCMRAALLKANGLRYDETLTAAQDYEFWTRCACFTGLDNIPEPLLWYRIHRGSVSQNRQAASDEHATAVVRGQLRRLLPEATTEQVGFHRRIGHGAGMGSREELVRAGEWLELLLKVNLEKAVWPRDGLKAAVSFAWFRVCQNSIGLGPWVWRYHRRASLSRSYSPPLRAKALFGLNALMGGIMCRRPAGNLEIWDDNGSKSRER